MAKDIKCILVDVDKLLISEIEEVDAELGNPNCKSVSYTHLTLPTKA